MNRSKPEVECTSRCKSHQHGQIITAAITKRSVTDKALASFIKATCGNFLKVLDSEGRSALHMAASRGRVDLLEWLILHLPEAFINAKDGESGYTPLHRSVFYGQVNCAVTLMKMGANTEILDKDDYKPFDHALLDRRHMLMCTNPYHFHQATKHDVYVWGTNCNYTLGTGSNQPRNIPDLLSTFSRPNTSIKRVCLGKFHSVFLCAAGRVWVAGQAARAGGPHCTALRPAPLALPEPCLHIALTLDSTVMVLESGLILQYALNNSDISQSSTKTLTSIKLPNIKPLMKLTSPLGVRAAKSHVVAWNSQAVYTWGTNLGQLGHQDKVVQWPKKVAISINNEFTSSSNTTANGKSPRPVSFHLVDAGDAATVITTTRGDVYLLHKNIIKKIAIKQINLRQVCVEGKVNDQGVYSRVTVLLLTNVGQLLLWQDTTNRVTRCVFGFAHEKLLLHIALTHDSVCFITELGDAYTGTISRKVPPPTQQQPIKKEREKDGKSSLVKFLEKDDCTPVKITKIPNIHRGISITVDAEGLNFACFQVKPNCGMSSEPRLSPSNMAKHLNTLRETASEDDLLHDVVFKVSNRTFPAHMFIIASSSPYLHKLYQETIKKPGEKPTIELDNVHPDIFERIMKFMYTGSCDVTEIGPCDLKIKKEDLVGDKKEKDGDSVVDEIENPMEVSAPEVYKSARSVRRASRGPSTPTRGHADPVRALQAAARRLNVGLLQKRLDHYYYRDDEIHLKETSKDIKHPLKTWDREAFPELVDTIVLSKEGTEIPAHKCVLAARLEYFNSMFMHAWTESGLLSNVTIPISDCILLPVINFLYTDTCPEIANSESMDYICNMLTVADQMFISRLREMCEVSLVSMITLKNCAELCQFANTYNAIQLKNFCMEFISLNICTVLENRTLNMLEKPLLTDITAYYFEFNRIMACRNITPFCNAPTDADVQESGLLYPVNLNLVDEDIKKDDSLEMPKKKNKSKKIDYTDSEKERMRYESVSSVTSLDLTNDIPGDISLSLSEIKDKKDQGKQGKWIEVPSSQKQQKVVQARLKAISNAKDILNETPVESYTKLTRNFSAISVNSPENAACSRMSVSPKGSPTEARSPQGNLVISHVGPKMSQKQRKKLAMQGDQSPNSSFDRSFASPPESPKNPWKINEAPVASCSSPKARPVGFNDILTAQRKLKEDSSRIMTKPLALTQLEDRAIEQLERFYNVHEIDDEYITVRRIELQVYSPQWLHTAPK